MIRDVAGRQNHSVKLVRKLQQKKHRRERGLLVGEGMDLLTAAAGAGAEIRDVLVRRDLVGSLPPEILERAGDAYAGPLGLDLGICDSETLGFASSLGGAADVLFTCVQPQASLGDVRLESGLTLFLCGVGDPGNVGTIVRSALAFDVVGVLCSPGTADPYSPKAMRAGMGAQFGLPLVTEVRASDLWARLAGLDSRGLALPEVWVAEPRGGVDVRDILVPAAAVVVLGAEREGVGGGWETARKVTIAQRGVDSLNVAMAATVLAYEWSGLRRAGVAK